MTLLLERRGNEIHTTEEVDEAAVRYKHYITSSMISDLIRQREDKISMTEEAVVQIASM